ncbi:hypothetical protein [Vogesella alkaliphila]|uniref:Uncharacterized protein n=1 Tax=Vogesella alkaliphila TaxID=1193621 RepID=A0ABQ2YNP9_9NEIS|nr:hypothetical protein [Vogesella alkaliphila]GGX87744.1 hypothetical protein GCM10011290_14180 [Vogesella alkaliphila]
MLASIGTLLLQDIYGKKLSSILADLSGVDVKTWKNGGPKSPEKVEYAKKQIERTVFEKLKIAGWNKENINDRVYGASTRCNGTTGIFSTLIDIVSGHGLYRYERSMQLANALDVACDEWNALNPPKLTKLQNDPAAPLHFWLKGSWSDRLQLGHFCHSATPPRRVVCKIKLMLK